MAAALIGQTVPDDGLPALALALQAAGLPAQDLDNDGRRFWCFLDVSAGGRVVGYGGLEVYGTDALLRSVVVEVSERKRGCGRAIVECLLAEAVALGVARVHLLTDTAAGFFARLGFAEADRATVPASIAATTEFARLCPASALYMRRGVSAAAAGA
jgi:amino-acid N-acetyltransferase